MPRRDLCKDALVESSSIVCIFAVVPTPDQLFHPDGLYCHGPDAAQSSKAYARSISFAGLLHGLVGYVGHSDGLVIAPIRTGLDATTPWCLGSAFEVVTAAYEGFSRLVDVAVSAHPTSPGLFPRIYPLSLKSSEPNAAISSSELPNRQVYQHEGKALNIKV